MNRVRILHTNDMHGTLGPAQVECLKILRSGCDLYFDSGDAIKTGNLGIPLRPEAVWPMLDDLGCTASVIGNRETHILASAFEAKLAGSRHPILAANLRRRDGSNPLPATLETIANGTRIGVVGVTVPMVTRRMKTQAASAFLWESPVEEAVQRGKDLRWKCDFLIALTHIGHRHDLELAERNIFDLILGGHSHTVIASPERVGKTWICQGGSHNRYAGVYEWQEGELTGGLVDIKLGA